ncbi:MAG: hypothetical protein IRZ03_17670 [Acidobacterium ailaaui]|nr:hypothetical protein [Pseudacidobacterium ailaaui]
MATTTGGYDLSIRQALRNKGIQDSQIGYSNGYVTVNGQNFMKPGRAYQGTAFTTQSDFDNAWNAYSNALKSTTQSPVSSPTIGSAIRSVSNAAATPSYSSPSYSATTYNPYNTNNPYDKQYSELISSLLNQVKNQQPVNVNDIYNSPQYAAYQAQAQKQAQAATRAAQEAFGASGFGRSSDLANTVQDYQNQANEYLSTQVLPQLIAQAENERQQQLQNQISLLNELQQAQSVYDTRYNNAQDLAIRQGELTGNYVNPAAYSLINQILQEKQNYAAATTPEARQQANANANALRSQLAALGVDPSLFGANQTLAQAQANISRAGTPTLAAQNQQFNQNLATRQQDLNEMQVMAELTGMMPDGTPTNAYQQQQLANLWKVADETGVIPDQLADMYGLQHGTQTQAAKQFVMNYNRSVLESDRDYALRRDQLQLDYINAANRQAGSSGAPTVSASVAAQYLSNALTKVVGTDPTTKKPVYGTISDPETREKAFIDAVNSTGIAYGPDVLEMLVKAGYTPQEIAKYQQKYPQAFQPAA